MRTSLCKSSSRHGQNCSNSVPLMRARRRKGEGKWIHSQIQTEGWSTEMRRARQRGKVGQKWIHSPVYRDGEGTDLRRTRISRNGQHMGTPSSLGGSVAIYGAHLVQMSASSILCGKKRCHTSLESRVQGLNAQPPHLTPR